MKLEGFLGIGDIGPRKSSTTSSALVDQGLHDLQIAAFIDSKAGRGVLHIAPECPCAPVTEGVGEGKVGLYPLDVEP